MTDILPSLRMKKTATTDLSTPIYKFVLKQHGKAQADELQKFMAWNTHRKVIQDSGDGKVPPTEAVIENEFFAYWLLLQHGARHFPIDDGTLGVKFTWTDPIAKTKVQSTRTALEGACVLYNAAVAYHSLANHMLHTNGDLVVASKHLQVASGLFEHCRSLVRDCSPVPPELSQDYMIALSELCLCEAHHCAYLLATKSPSSSSKHELLAKLAMEGSVAYAGCSSKLSKDAFRKIIEPNTVKAVELYRHVMEARAHVHMAHHTPELECGLVIAHLTAAQAAMHKTSTRDMPNEFGRFQHVLTEHVKKTLATAVENNNKIYHERIPATAPHPPRLEKLMVKQTPIDSISYFQSGMRDPFGNILPRQALEAQTSFKADIARLVQEKVGSIAAKRAELKAHVNASGASGIVGASVSASLGNAGGRGGLPPQLQQRIVSIQGQCGDAKGEGYIHRILQERFDGLVDLSKSTVAKFQEVQSELQQEKQTDDACRNQFGPRWTRPFSAVAGKEHHDSLQSLKQRIDQAAAADQVVGGKISGAHFRVLEDPVQDIDAQLRNTGAGEPAAPRENLLDDLTSALSDFHNSEAKEQALVNELKSQVGMAGEHLAQKLAAKKLEEYPAVMEAEREPFVDKIAEIDKVSCESEQLHAKILQDVTQLQSARAANVSAAAAGQRQREQRIGDLDAACNRYEEVVSHLREGVNFWGIMTEAVDQNRDRISGWVLGRELQRQDFVQEIGVSSQDEANLKATMDLIAQMKQRGEI